jgi:hypothetical protein
MNKYRAARILKEQQRAALLEKEKRCARKAQRLESTIPSAGDIGRQWMSDAAVTSIQTRSAAIAARHSHTLAAIAALRAKAQKAREKAAAIISI